MSSCFSCKKLIFSPIIGIDASKFSDEDDYAGSNGESLIGYQVGIDAIVPFNDLLSFESGLHLAGKGNKSSFSGDGFSSEDKINMTYIDLPMLARYNVGQGGFSVYGGLQPSILLNANQKTVNDDSEDSQKVTDQFKTLDLAGSIGVGYQFSNGVRLNLGYDYGFSNISANQDFGTGKVNNRTFKLIVGYTLGQK